MSQLAPGRTHDIAKLIGHRDGALKYSHFWNVCQAKIYDLVEEGNCSVVCQQRAVLVRASIARDEPAVEKASRIIEEHVQRKHPRRFYRAWSK